MFCSFSLACMKLFVSGVIVSSVFLVNSPVASELDSSRGNQTFQSFNRAKKALEHNVIYDQRIRSCQRKTLEDSLSNGEKDLLFALITEECHSREENVRKKRTLRSD